MKMKGNLNLNRWRMPFLFLLAASCTNEKDPEPTVDCNVSDLAIQVVRSVDLTGCDTQDGLIEMSSTGGEGEKQFSLNGGAAQSSGLFEDLLPGTYTLLVTDANGCTAEVDVALGVTGSNLAINNVISTNAGCTTSDGVITVTATGDGPLEYKLDDGTFQTGNQFSGLLQGSYNITVKDGDCETSLSHQVLSGVSFSSQIETIITSRCALSGCHDGSLGASRNWTVFTNVRNNATSIRNLTQSGSMPPAGNTALTQEQKDLIACWVDDGAPAN